MHTPRVVSLLPSATEIVCHIGAAGLLVGRSHECDFPESVRGLPTLTASRTHFTTSAAVDQSVRKALTDHQSLYSLDADRLAALRPDVIITQDLCDVCSIDLATVRRVAASLDPAPVVVSLNPTSVEDVFDDYLEIGAAIDQVKSAEGAVTRLRERMYTAMDYVANFAAGPTVAFLDWTDPLFIAGHWTPQLIERAGGTHPLNPTVPIENAGAAAGPIGQSLRRAGKSIRIPVEVLAAVDPDLILIGPCGLTLDQAMHEASKLSGAPWWRELRAVKRGRVGVIDGNQMFSRPGPRLVDGFEFLVGLLNDRAEVVPVGFPWRWIVR